MTNAGTRMLKQGADELGVELTDPMLSQFRLLFEELQKWNKKINLTAVRDEPGIVIKHFLDSLTVVKYLPPEGKVLDIGSGGGFPALPLKILRPELHIFSVDAVEKKILFQRHVARTLGIKDFTALHARAETLPQTYSHAFNGVITRAFSELFFFGELAAPLVAECGLVIAMKGPQGNQEAVASKNALNEIGIEICQEIPVQLPFGGDQRLLVIMQKKNMLLNAKN